MELIDRQAVLDEVQRFIGYLDQDMIDRLNIAIGRLPYAEPKTGRWKPYPIADGCIQCSVCGILRMGEPSNFCPNCGAMMKGEADG